MSFNTYTLEYTNNASLTAIKHDRIDWEATAIQSDDHGKHGNIKGFSRRSRQNLLRKMAQMDRTKLQFDPLFVTLTDQGDFETDARQFKQYLDNFLKRLIYKFPDCCAVWRIEFQQRGALHLHIIVFGVRYICKDWLAQQWNRITIMTTYKLELRWNVVRVSSIQWDIAPNTLPNLLTTSLMTKSKGRK